MNVRKTLNRIVFGLLFIGAGVGYICKFAGICPNFTIFFPGWWTLFIIVPMILSIINDGPGIFNISFLLLGVALLLSNDAYNIIEFRQFIWVALAALLIIIGVRIICAPMIRRARYNRTLRSAQKSGTYYSEPAGKKKYSYSFACATESYGGRVFEGASISVNFGSMTFDLREAIFNCDTVLDISSAFGEVNILLPDSVNIKLNSSSFLGGVNNRHRNSEEGGLPTVIINAGASFGVVNIK